MSQLEEICGPFRKIKIGEELEVLNYPPQLRRLALELPRSYREKALTHWAAQNIDLSDPSDWELDEIHTYLITQASIYRRKAGYVRAHSEWRRIAAWEAKQESKQEALADAADADEIAPPPRVKDSFQHAVDSVAKLVNKKLWPAGRASCAKIACDFSCEGPS